MNILNLMVDLCHKDIGVHLLLLVHRVTTGAQQGQTLKVWPLDLFYAKTLKMGVCVFVY